MKNIKAIGFDLFDTLIHVPPDTVLDALRLLTDSLREDGIDLNPDTFKKTYRDAATGFIRKAHKEGKETHNRFWISATLANQGFDIPPDDERIARAVERYFSAFYMHCELIPGTLETLDTLKVNYKIGLLSNFTHGPAERKIMDILGLTSYFNVILISGELGYRKPHPLVFEKLSEALAVEPRALIYIGDNPDADIVGAGNAGMWPVWMTYVKNHKMGILPGFLKEPVPEPGSDVPRISELGGLLELLEETR